MQFKLFLQWHTSKVSHDGVENFFPLQLLHCKSFAVPLFSPFSKNAFAFLETFFVWSANCAWLWKEKTSNKWNFETCFQNELKAQFFLYGRGGRNRTLLWSFGDSHSTDELHPYKVKSIVFYYFFSLLSIFYTIFFILLEILLIFVNHFIVLTV